MNEFLTKIIAILFPRSCLICRTDISAPSYKYHVCSSCQEKIRWINPLIGEQLGPLDGFHAAAEFSFPLREILHFFKYQGKDYLYEFLVDLWTKSWAGPSLESIDAIVPIPMPFWRETMRGYNQAALLGEELGRRWRKPVIKNWLKRRIKSSSQTNLGRRDRLLNAESSFYLNRWFRKPSLPKAVLLVDDIFTTGATIKTCAKLLKKEGVQLVFGSTIAREI